MDGVQICTMPQRMPHRTVCTRLLTSRIFSSRLVWVLEACSLTVPASAMPRSVILWARRDVLDLRIDLALLRGVSAQSITTKAFLCLFDWGAIWITILIFLDQSIVVHVVQKCFESCWMLERSLFASLREKFINGLFGWRKLMEFCFDCPFPAASFKDDPPGKFIRRLGKFFFSFERTLVLSCGWSKPYLRRFR